MAPWIAHALTRVVIGWKSRGFQSIEDFQLFLSHYFAELLKDTVSGFTVSGVDQLDPEGAYLYISNHRDIVMDTGLVNYSVHKAGFDTPEAAVGDNLFTDPLATDLMRLNKSFVIERERGRQAGNLSRPYPYLELHPATRWSPITRYGSPSARAAPRMDSIERSRHF